MLQIYLMILPCMCSYKCYYYLIDYNVIIMSDVGHQEDGGWLSWFGKEPVGAFFQPSLRPLLPAVTHTMFMDVTLNNHSSIQVCLHLQLEYVTACILNLVVNYYNYVRIISNCQCISLVIVF